MIATKHNGGLPISFVIAVNDEHVLRTNALASPDLHNDHGHEVLLQSNFPSAGLAYNEGIEKAKHDLIVCLHQDIYLPALWIEKLQATITLMEASHRKWGVLGCYGVSLQGVSVGHIFSNGLNRELGSPRPPVPVQSLDEAVLVLRKSCGPRFDSGLPHFHLYGTDICLQARQSGLENYAMSNFCVHNSIAIKRLPPEFWRCAEYLRIKWRNALPVKTCCVTLSPRRSTMLMTQASVELRFLLNRRHQGQSIRLVDPGSSLANLQFSF